VRVPETPGDRADGPGHRSRVARGDEGAAPRAAFHEHEAHIPITLGGSVFLKRYGGTTDRVTTVDPERCYAVWTPTAHPVYEHERVTEWSNLLQPDQSSQPDRPTRESRLGELMYASHASYSACGLGSDGTDLLVDLARAAGAEAGIYGAKITGGGSGGTVAVLARAGSERAIRALAARYEQSSGRKATVIGGSSPGSAEFGVLWLEYA